MIPRRKLIYSSLAALGGTLAYCSSRPEDALCPAIEPFSLLDHRKLHSWELCGRRRDVWVKREAMDTFWKPIPDREGRNYLEGADASGEYLIVKTVRQGKYGLFLVANTEGVLLDEVPSPGPEWVATLHVDTRRQMLALSEFAYSERHDKGAICLWSPAQRRWTSVAHVNFEAVRGLTLGADCVLWSENGKIRRHLIAEQKEPETLIEAEYPSLSPDATLLYFRDSSGAPAICEWPSMRLVLRVPNMRAGRLGLWSPNGRCLLIEAETRTGLYLHGVDIVSKRSFNLGWMQVMGSLEPLSFVNWKAKGPEAMRSFSIKTADGTARRDS